SGFEILFFIYPFVDNKEKIKMPVFLALFYTKLVLLLSTITVIGYFNPLSLEDITWSLLSLFKNVSYSFIERLDYIVFVACIIHVIYIQKLTDIVSQLGFWLIFIYPLVLLPIVLMKKMAKKGSVK